MNPLSSRLAFPNRARVGAAFISAVLLAGCATSSPDVVQRRDAQRAAQVQDAVVLSVRKVVIDGEQSGLGGTTGAVIGGIAGSTRSQGREQAAIAVIGAVAGAVVGNAIERASTREDAQELLLQLPNGERRVIVQAQGDENLKPGDAVLLITGTNGRTRVSRNPAGQAATTGPLAPSAPSSPTAAQPPVFNAGGRP